ncbi:MAG: hypothetical protein KAJ10_03730 [Thermodesulfovibrionia bacterium]|nr:hypothetical protein [Thermodesulfovibrionia bacterium]
MLEKLLSLFERLVVALETIGEHYVVVDGQRIHCVSNEPAPAAPAPEPAASAAPAPEPAASVAPAPEPAASVAPAPEPAPAAPAPEPAPAAAVNAELDTEHMPWDVRINNKGRTTKVDGSWKLIRSIETNSPGLVEQVQAELRAAGYGVPQTAVPAPAVPAPAVPAPAVPAGLTFPAFMDLMTQAGYTKDTVQPFLDKHGIQVVPMLAQNLEVMQAIATEMGLV